MEVGCGVFINVLSDVLFYGYLLHVCVCFLRLPFGFSFGLGVSYLPVRSRLDHWCY